MEERSIKQIEEAEMIEGFLEDLRVLEREMLNGRHDCALQKVREMITALGDDSSAGLAGTPNAAIRLPNPDQMHGAADGFGGSDY